MGSIPNGNGKMGIVSTGRCVITMTAMAIMGFFSTFHCRCRRSVNEPLLSSIKKLVDRISTHSVK